MAMTASSFTLTCETFHLCILTLYFYSYLFLLLEFSPWMDVDLAIDQVLSVLLR